MEELEQRLQELKQKVADGKANETEQKESEQLYVWIALREQEPDGRVEQTIYKPQKI